MDKEGYFSCLHKQGFSAKTYLIIDIVISAEIASLPWKYVDMDVLKINTTSNTYRIILMITFQRDWILTPEVFTAIQLLRNYFLKNTGRNLLDEAIGPFSTAFCFSQWPFVVKVSLEGACSYKVSGLRERCLTTETMREDKSVFLHIWHCLIFWSGQRHILL